MIYDAFGSYIPTFVLGIILSIIATILVWLVFSLTKRLEWGGRIKKASACDGHWQMF